MVIVGAKPVPYIYVAPKPPTTDEDDDDPWSGNGCLDSRWIKSSTTDHKQKFRDEDSIYHGGSFNFQQIKAATRNFHLDNKIGEGSYGSVYKGLLTNGMTIAVKQLSSKLMKSKLGKQEFLYGVGIMSALEHPNLVRLLGCCNENNQLLLVYEYMENNSLANALFGIGHLKLTLNWETRFKICLGIAKGLAFLHEDSKLEIIHGHIKPANILLDKDLNAKISDFGLAKHSDGGASCYMPHEYAMLCHLTFKADVYSFGVVMLEILSGKPGMDYRPNDETAFLLDQAYVLYQKDNLLELMDPNLKMDYNVSQANRALNLAIECTNTAPALRPKMSEVVSILKGRTELMSVPTAAPSSDEGFRKASTFAELSLSTHSGSTSRDGTSNHEKELLAGDHADIKDYDFEDAAPAMLHDNLSLMDEEEEEDNISGVDPNEFEAGSSIPNVNNDQSIGDQTTEEGWKDDVKLLTERKFPIMSGPSESSNARESWSDTTLFTDHVTKMNEEDKRNLEYVEPTFDEDGKLCIEYSEEEFEEGCNEWKDSLVGFFVGDDKPVIMNTILNKQNVETLWGVKGDDAVAVLSMEHDYFLIRFKYVEDKIKVLESGPWHIENRPLILEEWNWKLKFDKANEIKTLPIWVKIYNLPLFLWTSSYLSKVGSALGTPLYSDEKTKNKERLDFVRLCIEVDAGKSLPNSLNISIKAVEYEIKFEYEWKPLQCYLSLR